MHAPDSSIVVVTWNSAAELPGLLESIDAHLAPVPELVIVDNASTDDSVDVARRLAPDARLVELTENRGYGGGANAGTRAASGGVVALLNPDILLVDDSLVSLVALAASERAIFGPRLLNRDRTPQISAFTPVASWELALLVLWPGQLMPRRLRGRCDPWRLEESTRAGWLSGACLVARRELMLSLGPFDEAIHLYGEDIDLSLRAHKLGAETVFAPDRARLIHLGGRSADQRFTDRGQREKIATRVSVVRRHKGRLRAWLDWASLLAIAFTRLMAKAALRRDTNFERGYLRAALHQARPLSGQPS